MVEGYNLDVFVRFTKEDSDYNFIKYHFFKHERHKIKRDNVVDDSLLNKHIDFVLAKAKTAILHPEESPDQIISFAVFNDFKDSLVIHFICTKPVFRNMGFASKILKALPIKKHLIVTSKPKMLTLAKRATFLPEFKFYTEDK